MPYAQATTLTTSALQTMKNWFESLNTDLLSENTVWKIAEGYPVSKTTYNSKQEVINEFFPELRAHFSEWKVEVSNLVEDGDKVVATGHYKGLVKKTNLPIVVEFTHSWIVQNGLIVGLEAKADTIQFANHNLYGAGKK